MAAAKKYAARKGQPIVFVDESGLSERPHRCRTSAPRGQTPVLQHHFNWTTLSMIAGLSLHCFRIFPGSIRAPQVVDFLGRLLRFFPGRLLVISDGLGIHGSHRVRDLVDLQGDRLRLEFLPAYAPELNPVEYLWGHATQHGMPNLCPDDSTQLRRAARRALSTARRRPSLLSVFWKQANLF